MGDIDLNNTIKDSDLYKITEKKLFYYVMTTMVQLEVFD